MLQKTGLDFECIAPEIDEETFKVASSTPYELALQLSEAKARDVQKRFPQAIIIGGDQVLEFAGQILDKPLTVDKAIFQLDQLQGQTHYLRTGLCLLYQDKCINTVVSAKMEMKALTGQQIANYIKKDQPLWSCGSYKIEELGQILFKNIECPDHSSIVGLPLCQLYDGLKQFGIAII